MKFPTWSIAALWASLILCMSCATPSSPTGGPPDEEGPEIVSTEPETGTTNFDERSITLHFSEFVERSSLQQALVIEPDIGISYDLDWGRKSVKIVFDQAIPDETTLIVTVGTEFEDTNNNAMARPYKVAVSTGPEIDEGKLYGQVIDAQSGEGRENQRVLLYRDPFDLSETADYIASTDTSGTFQFSYLSEGKYKVFWVDDRNRNKIWEPEQERAQPFRQEFVELEKAEEDTIGSVYTTAVDTTNPTLQGIGLFSSQRIRMRFSENMQLTDSAEITVLDSLDKQYSEAYPLYTDPNDAFILFAHSEESLDEETSYGLEIEGILDEAGNELAEISQTFTGSSQEDTTQQRIITRNNLSGYYPTDPLEITYANLIDESVIRDSLKIVEGDTLIEEWPNVEIRHNLFRILPKERWEDGINYEVRTWDPQLEDYRRFEPEIWHESQMGALNIMAEDSTRDNIHLHIENEESGIVRDTTFSKEIEISNLPPLRYTVTAFHDQNDNGVWDYGQVSPFTKPEPYFIQQQVPVKRELTGDLTISFQD